MSVAPNMDVEPEVRDRRTGLPKQKTDLSMKHSQGNFHAEIDKSNHKQVRVNDWIPAAATFLAGGCLFGMLVLAYLTPFMIEQNGEKVRAQLVAELAKTTAPIAADASAAKTQATLAVDRANRMRVNLEERKILPKEH